MMASRGVSNLRIVIADDHPLVLSALRHELESAGFVVCGEAATGADALELVLTTHPRLTLLDEDMPEGEGAAVAAVLIREAPDVKVALLGDAPNEEGAGAAAALGAVRLDRTMQLSDLVRHLHELAADTAVSAPCGMLRDPPS